MNIFDDIFSLDSDSSFDEDVANTVGDMLPQCNITTDSEENNIKDEIYEFVISRDIEFDVYTEKSIFDSIKNKLLKTKIENIQKAYIVSQIFMLKKRFMKNKVNSKFFSPEDINMVDRLSIKYEKDFRKIYSKASETDKKIFNKSKPEIDNIIKDEFRKVEMKNNLSSEIDTKVNIEETYDFNISDDINLSTLFEAAEISDKMRPIISLLNRKGYKTRYSSPGYSNEIAKNDRNKDGVRNGKLYTTARIMFAEPYKFPKPPKYWIFRQVDKVDYLDVDEKWFNPEGKDNPKEAWKKWQDKYMSSLEKWVNDLDYKTDSNDGQTDINDYDDDEKISVRNHTNVNESSLDSMYESMIDELFLDMDIDSFF